MRHRGYEASIEFDSEAGLFHGEVIGLRDVVTFQAGSSDRVEAAFVASVEDYLAFCDERRESPDPPFTGDN